MGLLSWLFPNDDELLARAKKKMAAGAWESARKDLVHCKADEAEALYEECSKHIDRGEKEAIKGALAKQGFHGFALEVNAKGEKRRREIEGLVREELAREGIDLDLPEVDEGSFKRAIERVRKRARGGAQEIAVRLVPRTKPR